MHHFEWIARSFCKGLKANTQLSVGQEKAASSERKATVNADWLHASWTYYEALSNLKRLD